MPQCFVGFYFAQGFPPKFLLQYLIALQPHSNPQYAMNQNNIDFCLKGDASFDSFKTLFVEARDNFGEVDHGVIKMELLFPWPH